VLLTPSINYTSSLSCNIFWHRQYSSGWFKLNSTCISCLAIFSSHLLIFRKEWELRVCWASPGGMTLLFTGHLACFTMSFRTLLSRSPTNVTDLQWKRKLPHFGNETVLLMTGVSSFSGQLLSAPEMS